MTAVLGMSLTFPVWFSNIIAENIKLEVGGVSQTSLLGDFQDLGRHLRALLPFFFHL